MNIFCKLRKEVVTHKTQMYFFVKKNLKICVFCVEDFKNAVISRLCVATGLEKSPLCWVCWLCARTHKKVKILKNKCVEMKKCAIIKVKKIK